MKKPKIKIGSFLFWALFFCAGVFIMSSCGYNVVGSRLLPVDSVTIKQVKNNTYEPKLQEKMHRELSEEFIKQGIEVKAAQGDIDIEAVITTYALGAIGAVDETVKEQEIIMFVDILITDQGETTEFRGMKSPLKITFQTTGSVSEVVARQDLATEKACREVAKEIVSRTIIKYAK